MKCLLFLLLAIQVAASDRSFVIDYDHNQFLRDGQPFRYVSGTLHYFQVPAEYWEDRLTRARAMGLNAIETYIMWSFHEPLENQYNFAGRADIEQFFEIANKLGLLVILRPGPFIDAEQDMGGFPAWLLKTPDIKLRTFDPNYIAAVTKWFQVLLPKVRRHLYKYGGPVVMVQIENEYGSYYACDRNYIAYMRDLNQKLLGANDVIYFTTDGAAEYFLRCGVIPGVYPTVDFGTGSLNDTMNGFAAQRKYAPKGPLVNSEFYPGWFDQWGDSGHHTLDANDVVSTVTDMWHLNASFNFYPIHGGTNWDYQAGGEGGDKTFSTVVTSYDYDAPISEAGDITPKFMAVRNALEKLAGIPNPYPVPKDNEKLSYGQVEFKPVGNLFELLHVLCPDSMVVRSKYPVTAENLDHPYGFILYETFLTKGGSSINLTMVHDRGYVFASGQLITIVQRPEVNATAVSLAPGTKLQILVENQGRVCYGSSINDSKGIVGNVTLDGQVLVNWTIRPLNLNLVGNLLAKHPKFMVKKRRFGKIDTERKANDPFVPTFYVGSPLLKPHLADTFFDPSGWGKGNLFVNGFNVGRYWPSKGPQVTLYVPKPFLSDTTQLMMFELEKPGNCNSANSDNCFASFTDQANIGKTEKMAHSRDKLKEFI